MYILLSGVVTKALYLIIFLLGSVTTANAEIIHYNIVMQQDNLSWGIRPLVGGFDIDSANLTPNSIIYYPGNGALTNFSMSLIGGQNVYPFVNTPSYIYDPNLPMFVPGGQGATYPGPMITTDANNHIIRLDGTFYNHSPSILSNLLMTNNQYYELGETPNGNITISAGNFALTSVAPVPVPANVWLLILALPGLALFNRKKKTIHVRAYFRLVTASFF